MVLLTRKDIINGASERQEVEIPLLGQTISLRPLTDGEYAEIEAIRKDVGEIKTNLAFDEKGGVDVNKVRKKVKADKNGLELKLDLKKSEEMNYYADCLTTAYGLSNEQERFTPEDVRNMRPLGVVSQIADAVIRISKLDEPEKVNEEMKTFREKK